MNNVSGGTSGNRSVDLDRYPVSSSLWFPSILTRSDRPTWVSKFAVRMFSEDRSILLHQAIRLGGELWDFGLREKPVLVADGMLAWRRGDFAPLRGVKFAIPSSPAKPAPAGAGRSERYSTEKPPRNSEHPAIERSSTFISRSTRAALR
jgi:hypothetical protein